LIFVDTNVVSEFFKKVPSVSVVSWFTRFEVELALTSVSIAELSYGIAKVDPRQRPKGLEDSLKRLRDRFVGRTFPFTDDTALIFGQLLGDASRKGREMSVLDGMIAAMAVANGGRLATRNVRHFETTGLELINPWDF